MTGSEEPKLSLIHGSKRGFTPRAIRDLCINRDGDNPKGVRIGTSAPGGPAQVVTPAIRIGIHDHVTVRIVWITPIVRVLTVIYPDPKDTTPLVCISIRCDGMPCTVYGWSYEQDKRIRCPV